MDRTESRGTLHAAGGTLRLATSPALILAATALLCAILLALPLSLPIGAMYWDLVVLVDGAQRVATGQIPSIDFFAPVGPLGYWLMAGANALFPDGQPLLLAQWSLLAVTLPTMAVVLSDVDHRSRSLALALLLPFLVFQLLPMNVEQYSSFPTTDGYGIYNRQVCEILYVLSAALVFGRSQRRIAFVAAVTLLALFLLKVTGFLAGGLLCAFAFAAGRIAFRTTLAVAAAFFAVLAGLELWSGIVTAYVADIATLVAMNEESLLPRFLQAASIHFGIFGSGALLVAALLVITRRETLSAGSALLSRPRAAAVAGLLDRPVLWLGAGLAAGLLFETQNTGGQAFIFVWPMLLAVLLEASRHGPRSTVVVLALVAATAMPPLVNVLHRFSRAMIGQINYVAVPNEHLGTLGAVTQRPEAIERAHQLHANYAAFPDAYQSLADNHLLPAISLYSDIDFQIGWLMAADEAAEAILAREAATGQRFETIMSLNFANPFPTILAREGTPHIAIGADPFRAVPPPDAETLTAVAATDLILYPTCPITSANAALLRIYAPAMEGREAVTLSPCWIGYIRDGGPSAG